MNRFLLLKGRLGAAQYWSPLENRVSNFKLTVLSRQNEFLSGTGTVEKLRFSSFAFYVRYCCQNHFGTCKFGKGVARNTKMLKLWIRIHNLKDFGDFEPGIPRNCWICIPNTIKMVDSRTYTPTPAAHQFSSEMRTVNPAAEDFSVRSRLLGPGFTKMVRHSHPEVSAAGLSLFLHDVRIL